MTPLSVSWQQYYYEEITPDEVGSHDSLTP